MDVKVKLIPNGDSWDLKAGDFIFHFPDAQSLRNFSNEFKAREQVIYDPQNDQKSITKYLLALTRYLRNSIKKQLQERTINQLVNYLQTERTFRFTDVGVTVEEI